jgi:phytoene synthase
MTRDLAESYRHCSAVVRKSGSNFALALWLLPPAQRRATHALYAFAWQTDSIADGERPDDEKRRMLANWRTQVAQALAGDESGPALLALADTVRRFDIPAELLLDLVDGVGQDLQQQRFATYDELSRYCYRVAGTVGLACLHIWGCRDCRARELAKACGEAFQLTNILRDVREDAARGRIYLPLEDLERFDYSPDELLRGVADQRLDRLLRWEISRADEKYAVASALDEYLTGRAHLVFRLMFARYRALLSAIRRRPEAVLRGRISLSWPRKAAIVAREAAASLATMPRPRTRHRAPEQVP